MSEDYLYKPKMNYISYSRKGKVEEQYNCHIIHPIKYHIKHCMNILI